jgi:DNA repair protein RadC
MSLTKSENRGTDGHKGQGHRRRLRERFLQGGLSGFHDYEIVELLLTLATPRRDCKDAAKAALAQFGSFQGVLDASARELTEIEGIGPRNMLGIRLIKAVAERYLEMQLHDKVPLNHSQALFDYLDGSLRGRRREQFKALFLDAKNHLLAVKTLFRGTVTAASVYPQEVVRAALDHHAAALIVAHNHPSGDPKPSPEDVALTRKLLFASRAMGITLHEHLVVGEGRRYYSFADEGHIARMNAEFDTVCQ